MRSKFKWIFTLLMALTMQFSFAQEKTITGTVSDGNGPLPGVNVVVKGTQRGVQTNFDGTYSIKASAGETLVYSFMGMRDISKVVGSGNVINTIMQDDSKVLTEVVVTAMNIKKRSDALTSTTQVVKAKEITQASNPSIIQSLTGKVSGLQINTTSNGANPTTRIVLRGNRSVTGNNEALVVIDGAISSASVLGQLPPESIDNLTVIKGQQGGALYGEQGVNGVIIVTTKKGSKDSKLTVQLNSSVDVQSISFLPKRQTSYGQGWAYGYDFDFPGAGDPRSNSIQFSPYENGAWGPAFNDPDFAGTIVPVGLPQADGKFITTTWNSKGSDNIKDFFRNGIILQNGITLNGGGEDGYAMLNLNRQTTDFVVDGDALKRNSFMFKAGKKVGKLKIDGTLNYINQSVTQTSGDLFDDLLQTATNIPVGAFRNSGHEGNWTVYAKNPFQYTKQIRFDDRSDLFVGNLSLAYELNKHITVSYLGNVRTNSSESQSHNDGFISAGHNYDFAPYTDYGSNITDYETLGGQGETSSYYNSQNRFRKYYGDIIVNFDYDLTKDLNLKLNVGNNIQEDYSSLITQGGKQLGIPGFYHISNIIKPDNPSTLANTTSLRRRAAVYSNLDLDYKGYLFLNATARYEKSSTVNDGFFYPSAGLSFVPTKAFDGLKDNKVLNYAKLSASWVKLGNTSAVDPYAILNTASSSQGFPFGDINAYQYRRAQVSASIRPEFLTTKEANVNLGFLGDRITVDASYYISDTKDLITNTSASSTIGATRILDNLGNLRNKGFEIDLGLTPFKNDNGFTWNLKGSFSQSKNEILSLQDGATSLNLQSNTFVGVFAEVGQPFPLIKGTKFQRDPEGHIIVNSNGVPLRTSTFESLGQANPKFILGLSNTFSYKGLSLTAVADYRTGNSIYSEAYATMAFSGYTLESASQDRTKGYIVPNSVQQTGPNTYAANTTPTFNTTYGGGTYRGVLDYFSGVYNRTGEAMVLDASAVKIREIALSYSLPSKLISKAGLQSFKIGVNARNPFVFFIDKGNGLKNDGYVDPEASNTTGNATGIGNVGQYPNTKTYGVSLNVTF